MAQDLVSLDTATPQLEVPPTGETYRAPRAVAIAPETLTGSTATPALDIAQTWNTTGTPTALKVNVVADTGPSNAASNLLDLQLGGASRFAVNKAGNLQFGVARGKLILNGSGTFSETSWTFSLDEDSAPARMLGLKGLTVGLRDSGVIGWNSAQYDVFNSIDVALRRDAAGTLAQRNANNGQTYRIYGRYTDGSNYERLKFEVPSTSGTTALIGTEHQGPSFLPRALGFQTNGSTRFTLGTDGAATFTGSLTAGPATFNGATSTIASFTDVSTGSIFTVNNSAATALLDVTDVTTGSLLQVVNSAGSTVLDVNDGVWNAAGTTFTGLRLSVQDNASAAGSNLLELRGGAAGTTTRFRVNKSGEIVGNDNSGLFVDSAGRKLMNWSGTFQLQGFSLSFSQFGAGPDLTLVRDAANVLAQSNGDNGQTFRVYGRGGGTANFERAYIDAPTSIGAAVRIGTEKGGTGTARALEFQTDGVTRLTIAATGNLSVPNNAKIELGTTAVESSGGTLFLNAAAATSVIIRGSTTTYLNIGNEIVRFSGTTSSFPALKRSTTSLQARLADDSAFTNIQGKLTTEANAVVETPSATDRTITLYDAAGTAYKVPCYLA